MLCISLNTIFVINIAHCEVAPLVTWLGTSRRHPKCRVAITTIIMQLPSVSLYSHNIYASYMCVSMGSSYHYIVCLCTLREWYRSLNCDIGSTSTTHQWSSEVWSCASQLWDKPSERGWVPTCDSAHSWQLYSAASLKHEATGMSTCYPTQMYYPDTERTSLHPILKVLSTRLGSDKYQF